jgi:hypothetical protein
MYLHEAWILHINHDWCFSLLKIENVESFDRWSDVLSF